MTLARRLSAALRVKVIIAALSPSIPSDLSESSRTIRSTSSVVFPLPAAAVTMTELSWGASMALCCCFVGLFAILSCSRKGSLLSSFVRVGIE